MERDPGIVGNITRIISRKTGMPGAGYDNADPSQNSEPSFARVLCIGAGGLGCELLKCMALSGFVNIDCIDMDTIDLSNLNRQFLFREWDIGKPKANTAAAFINKRCPWMKVIPHFKKIQEFDDDFYRQFTIIVLGLDSIMARQWMNDTVSRIMYVERDGEKVTVAATPLIDGGTEGFKGHSRVITMGCTACFECTLDLFPPQVGIPMCTLENIPRQPEHCVMYVMQKTWDLEKPFGEGTKVDGDEPTHIVWLAEKAKERALKFNIAGDFDFAFTQGVTKNIIPALASSNAAIAAQCVNEALKIVTGMSPAMVNYFTMNGSSDTQGAFGTLQDLQPVPGCHVCQPSLMKCSKTWTPPELNAQALLPFVNGTFPGTKEVPITEISQLRVRINTGAGTIEFFIMQGGGKTAEEGAKLTSAQETAKALQEKTKALQSIPVYDTIRIKVSAVVGGDPASIAALMNVVQIQVDCKPGSRRVLLDFY